MHAKRLAGNPIIYPQLDPSLGGNINGPSLIRVPDWLPNPLGRYYLYFAHHQGKFIRLAYADRLDGPWKVHAPGTLRLEETCCQRHIASPDVHVDEQDHRLVMYYHGPTGDPGAPSPVSGRYPLGNQRSFVAWSSDGLAFTSAREILAPSYLRVFRWRDHTYGMAMPGFFYRSKDGLTHFVEGPDLFDVRLRHAAVRVNGHRLDVFFSRAGDCPERILYSGIDLRPDWMDWQASEPVTLLEPETEYEGGKLPLEASRRGSIHEMARQLRDPAIYEEAGRIYLLYSVAGEAGIAIAEILNGD